MKVFLSSTSRDLPECRAAALQACRELGLGVVAMEDFEAMGVGATDGSLAKVDQADAFLGLFAYRYGYVEPGRPASVTELEFDRARQRGLECLCFLVAPDHPWPEERKEHEQMPRLEAFKERLKQERIVRWFHSPDDLLHQVYRALEGWMERRGVRPNGPRQVPAPPPDFVGRDEDLRALESQLSGGASISAVHGLGGVGKTALALKLAERLSRSHPDGQLFFDLQGYTRPRTWQEAMAHVIHAFLPEERLPDGDAKLAALYRTVLTGKRVLLVLDNAADEELVRQLLPPPGCMLLVTARKRLYVDGLQPHDLDALQPSQSVALLRSIAPRLDEAAAAEIAERCGHLPLALRLAGKTLLKRRDLSPQRYLERLKATRLQMLNDVAASIRLSEEQLPELVRSKWPELSVLSGGFEASWAAAVWGVDETTAEDHLATLLEQSLLDWDDERQMYRLHDLVREYGRERMDAAAREGAEGRHARYFRDAVADAEGRFLKGAEIPDALRAFDRAWPDAQAAFAWAGRRPETDEEAARLRRDYPNRSLNIRILRQHPEQQVAWSTAAVAAARQLGDRAGEGVALNHLGVAHAALGRPRQAVEFFERRLAVAREIGDRRGEGSALSGLGKAYAALGQPAKAAEFHERRLALGLAIGDRRGEGVALGNLGKAYAALGDQPRAVEFHEKRLAVAGEIGDRRGVGNALGGLGLAYAALGQPRRAVEYHERRLAVAREIGDRRGEGDALGDLGKAFAALGESDRAVEHYQKSIAVTREIGDRQREAIACWDLGEEFVRRDRIAEAVPLMEACVRYESEIGHPGLAGHAARLEQIRQRLVAEGKGSA